jgi:hypothetical protein
MKLPSPAIAEKETQYLSSKKSTPIRRGCLPILGLLILMGYGALPASAATTVYRCTKNGQTTLTDRPCDPPADSANPANSPSSQSTTTIASSSTPSPTGSWRGQVQYQGRENGQELGEAHTVVPLTLEFTNDGKVSGGSVDNGCRMLGVWSQGGPPQIIWVDITLSACRFGGLDRRYTGSFLLAKPDSSGLLNVLATEFPHATQGARMYDVKGTLRR